MTSERRLDHPLVVALTPLLLAVCACGPSGTGASGGDGPLASPPSDAGSPSSKVDAATPGPDAGSLHPTPSDGGGDAAVPVDASPPRDGGEGRTDAAAPPAADSGADGSTPPSNARVVAYLPNYNGTYGSWATKIDFRKMTHLNLAFATATTTNGWDMGASDGDVKAIVDASHAAGTKVLASLGGGGGDQTVVAQYRGGGNVPSLVQNLDAFVTTHNLDGVDVDIEDPNNLGADYTTFVSAVTQALRPKGKLVTAAVAQYLQESMEDATLHSFDFVNVMIYTNYADSVSAMQYYTGTKNVPKELLTIGAGFFGTDGAGNEYSYADILSADGAAWSKDQAIVKGQAVNYTGVASMAKIASYSKGFGGIMFWELSQDVPGPHSLYQVIQSTM